MEMGDAERYRLSYLPVVYNSNAMIREACSGSKVVYPLSMTLFDARTSTRQTNLKIDIYS